MNETHYKGKPLAVNPVTTTAWHTSDGSEYAGPVHGVNDARGTAVYAVPWPCERCGGAGGSEAWRFTGWTCYACGGSGHRGRTRAVKVYSEVAYVKLFAARAKRDAARAAKEAARLEAAKVLAAAALEDFKTDNAAFVADLEAYAGRDAFLTDLRGKLIERGSLSGKQVAAARLALDKAAKETAAADCPAGRIELRGEVVSVKTVEGAYGLTVKMLVRAAEGFKVWCTVPSGLDAVKGAVVSFTATLEPSTDDPKFGFGKRPTAGKAAIA